MNGEGPDRRHSRQSDPRIAEQERAQREQEDRAQETEQLRRMAIMHRRWIQRKRSRDASPQAASAIPQSGGSDLAGDVRARMEPRLGADLSAVKVHTGAESRAAADELGARAFTVGSDIHFASGEFAPGTKEGDRLLAHELTHVAQGQSAGIQRKADEGAHGDEHEAGAAQVSEPHEPAEKEADAVGDEVAEGLHGDKQKEGAKEHPDQGAKAKEHAPPVAAKLAPTATGNRRVIMRSPKNAAAPAHAAPAPAGKNPFAGKLKGDPAAFVKQACAGDKIAMQKITDVEGERDIQDVPPKTAAGNFFKQIADNINNEQNLDVKHAYATAGFQQAAAPYLKMGHKIDKSKIAGLCSRTIRIENWWRFNCNQQRFLKQADQVTKGRLKGKEREDLAYSLMRLELSENPGAALGTLDRSKPIQPSGMHGWFTDDKVKLEPGKDAGFSQLMHIFALQPEVFAEGTVFIEISPHGLEGDIRKPTAYDGMQSSLWVPRPGDTFGVTGGGLREFLADAIKGSAVQSANARVPNSGLAEEIKKYNDDSKAATGSASATDATVRGEKPGKSGGKGKALTDSVVATTQHEREHPSPARGPRK